MTDVYRIVLTGSVCAGKTTALSYLYDRLSALGFRVYKVPEVARMVLGAGFEFSDFTDDVVLQAALLKAQIQLESVFNGLATAHQEAAAQHQLSKVILLFDRGRMDIKAFTKPKTWEAVVHESGLSDVELRDAPYDGIIHMVTAAIGARSAYINDEVRKETPERAIELDSVIRDAWVGHPHLSIIDNKNDGLDGKLKRTLAAVLRIVGHPVPIEIERKYLVKTVDWVSQGQLTVSKVNILQYYLKDTGHRIRKRGQNGRYVYTMTEKKTYGTSNVQRMEIEHQISVREFNNLLTYTDPNTVPISKQRTCFVWENQYFELDEFEGWHGLKLLEVELASEHQVVYLPPWIEIDREVTDDKNYSNHALAGNKAM